VDRYELIALRAGCALGAAIPPRSPGHDYTTESSVGSRPAADRVEDRQSNPARSAYATAWTRLRSRNRWVTSWMTSVTVRVE
jgi:hypothetical protein